MCIRDRHTIIQKVAPGPPKAIATATPAIFPNPTVPETAVAKADSFNDVIDDFFNPASHATISRSQGWYRLAYSASFDGLKNGRCESIELLKQGSNFALLSCKGPYKFKSALGLATDENMHIRVNMKQVNGQWYFLKSSLTHTMAGGRYPDRNIGIKFK